MRSNEWRESNSFVVARKFSANEMISSSVGSIPTALARALMFCFVIFESVKLLNSFIVSVETLVLECPHCYIYYTLSGVVSNESDVLI